MTSVVTRREGIKGSRPILTGTKLSVLQVAALVDDHEVSPEEIVEMYSGVDGVEMVYEALDYYENHWEDIEEFERTREESIERLERRTVDY